MRLSLNESLIFRDWHKIKTAAASIPCSPNEFLGAWVRWLFWKIKRRFDGLTAENLADKPELHVTRGWLDEHVALAGFADAAIGIGWLEVTPDGFLLSSAAARASYAECQASHEAKLRRTAENKRKDEEARAAKAAREAVAPQVGQHSGPKPQAGKIRKMLDQRATQK